MVNKAVKKIVLFELSTGIHRYKLSYYSSRRTRSVFSSVDFSVARAACASPLYSDCGWPQTACVQTPVVYVLVRDRCYVLIYK